MSDDRSFIERLKSGQRLKPDVAKVHVTERCNLRCIKCFQWKKCCKREMSYEELVRVIDECSDVKCDTINFIGGEPTLHPKLIDVIAYAGERGIGCGIVTNGVLVDRRYAQTLADSRLKAITISLDSHRPELHDRITGTEGSWERTVEAIRNVRRFVPQSIRNLRVNCVLSSLNFGEIKEYIGFIRSLGIDDLKFLPYECTGNDQHDRGMSLGDSMASDRGRELLSHCGELAERIGLQTNIARFFDKAVPVPNGAERRINEIQMRIPCFYPFYRIEIDIEGYVYPCCHLRSERYRLGNIFDSNMSSIVESERLREIRAALIPPIGHEECSSCWVAVDDNVEIMRSLEGLDVKELLKSVLMRNGAI